VKSDRGEGALGPLHGGLETV